MESCTAEQGLPIVKTVCGVNVTYKCNEIANNAFKVCDNPSRNCVITSYEHTNLEEMLSYVLDNIKDAA
jgi:hypothetical protein